MHGFIERSLEFLGWTNSTSILEILSDQQLKKKSAATALNIVLASALIQMT
jgi:hypothetical protein